MSTIPSPNVPEPAMPWAREITRLVKELTDGSHVANINATVLNRQIGSSAVATAAVSTVADTAIENAAIAQERAEAPVSDADLGLETLTVWPFIPRVIPGGSFASGAVQSSDIADFALTATKFNTNRHQIY